MTFLGILRGELQRRRCLNPRYSGRAFARNLRTDHATLSQILRGRRRLTPRSIRVLGGRLGLDRPTIERHCAAAKDAALLGFVGHASFRPNSRWIAVRLGLPVDDVNVSLQRLLYGKALLMPTPRHWVKTGA